MKKLLLIPLLAVLFVACLPSTPILEGTRLDSTTVLYTALEGPSLSVATATEFDGLPVGCEFVESFNDQAFCVAPASYEFKTDGKTSATIVDGFLFVSRPVIVE